ncbi:hypothetical protein KIPB_007300, partial [Kipferlia bialata]
AVFVYGSISGCKRRRAIRPVPPKTGSGYDRSAQGTAPRTAGVRRTHMLQLQRADGRPGGAGSLGWLMMSLFLLECLVDSAWLIATYGTVFGVECCPVAGYVNYALCELLMLQLMAMCLVSSVLILKPSSYRVLGTQGTHLMGKTLCVLLGAVVAVAASVMSAITGVGGASATSTCWFDQQAVLAWFDVPNVIMTTASMLAMLLAVIGMDGKQTPDQAYLAARLVSSTLPYALAFVVSEVCFLAFNLINYMMDYQPGLSDETLMLSILGVGCTRGVLMAVVYVIMRVKETSEQREVDKARNTVVSTWA